MEGGILMELLFLALALVAAAAIPNFNKTSNWHSYGDNLLHDEESFSGIHNRMLLEEDSLGTNQETDKRDVEALLSFKNGITADPMQSLSTWTANNSHNLCSWNGVWCRKRTKRVVAIILPQLELEGTISPSIEGLSLLHTLNLSENSLRGRIPPELGKLKVLRILDLYANQLEGSIPKSLANCTHMQSIKLSENKLTGSIPAEIGDLKKLEYLRLRNIGLSGKIPNSLGNCTSLLRLVLGLNSLTGNIPSELWRLGKLQYLSLESNKLKTNIPAGL
ncbi:hypothetical protein KI387_021951, partial [Taxus chinensis]